jgi:hypothetical protein
MPPRRIIGLSLGAWALILGALLGCMHLSSFHQGVQLLPEPQSEMRQLLGAAEEIGTVKVEARSLSRDVDGLHVNALMSLPAKKINQDIKNLRRIETEASHLHDDIAKAVNLEQSLVPRNKNSPTASASTISLISGI